MKKYFSILLVLLSFNVHSYTLNNGVTYQFYKNSVLAYDACVTWGLSYRKFPTCGGMPDPSGNGSYFGAGWYWVYKDDDHRQPLSSHYGMFYTNLSCAEDEAYLITEDHEYAWCEAPSITLPPKTLGPPGCGGVGNPCDPSTGNKYQKEIEYKAPKNGLSFIRHYNSGLKNGVKNSIGSGWGHNWEAKLEITESTITIRQADGRGELFHFSDNRWQGDADSHLSLTIDSEGYLLTNDQGVSEHYDLAGHLLVQTDIYGKQTQYSYNSKGLVETVTDAFGHVLTFSYNDITQLLETVTTPDEEEYHYEYDDNRNLIKVIYPDTTFRQYHYENSQFIHALTGITDENEDRYATFDYDTAGKAILTQHAQTDNGSAQEKFTLSYDSATQTTVTDATEMVEVLTYAENLGVKNLLSRINQTDQKGLVRQYDENNNLSRSTDAEDKVTLYSYNINNQRLSKTEAAETSKARVIEYQYLSTQLDLVTKTFRPSIKEGEKQKTQIEYNPDHTIQSITETGYQPDGTEMSRSTHYKYNSFGQVIEINGALETIDDITTLSYYECNTGGKCGQLASISNALNQTTSYDQYDANGRVTQITNPLGLITTYLYNKRGQITSITETPEQGDPRTTLYTYDNASQLKTLATPDGKTLTYLYDKAHDLRRITDNIGNYIAYQYDLKGNRSSENIYDPNDILVRTQQTEYDHRNRIKSINNAGSITQLVQDAVGNLVASTDPNQNPDTTHEYDPLHRLQQRIDALGNFTDYQYDTNDQLVQVITPNEVTTNFIYDDFGNQLQETSPDRGTTHYRYDLVGNLTNKTDARGISSQYQYDALHRVTTIDYPGTEEDIHYTYDNCLNGIGQLCQIEDQTGVTQYQYDSFGQRIKKQVANEAISQQINYQYDEANELIGLQYPSGRELIYQRNNLGQIIQISTESEGINTVLIDTIDYRADGLIRQINYGNGLQEIRNYDPAGRLKCKQLGDLPQQCYEYDDNGNILNIQQTANDRDYQYDALDRLTFANKNNKSTGYGLDSNSNRTEQNIDNSIESYITTPESNQLHSISRENNTYQYQYDANGNISDDGRFQYHYGNNNRLIKVLNNDQVIAQYRYNALGQRVKKQIDLAITYYFYDENGLLISETDNNGEIIKEYAYLKGQPIVLFKTAVHSLTEKAGTKQFTFFEQDKKVKYDNGSGLAFEGTAVQWSQSDTKISFILYADQKIIIDANHSITGYWLDGTLLTRSTGSPYDGYFTNLSEAFSNENNYSYLLEKVGEQSYQGQSQIDTTQVNLDTATRQVSFYKQGKLIAEDIIPVADWQETTVNDIRTITIDFSVTSKLIINGSIIEKNTPDNAITLESGQIDIQHNYISHKSFYGMHLDKQVLKKPYYIYTDHLDTPKVITDDKQTIVWQAEYDAFGKAVITTESVFNNIRFPGQYFDSETGLHYNYYRYYDPSTGRYITSDPIGLQGGLNTYAYVGGNPLRYVDPTGEFAIVLAAPVIGEAVVNVATIGLGSWVLYNDYFSDSDLQEEIEREANRREYKNRCSEPPPPGLAPCEKAKWKLQRAKDCKNLRKANTNRWWDGQDQVHEPQLDIDLDRAIRNAERAVERLCTKQCQ